MDQVLPEKFSGRVPTHFGLLKEAVFLAQKAVINSSLSGYLSNILQTGNNVVKTSNANVRSEMESGSWTYLVEKAINNRPLACICAYRSLRREEKLGVGKFPFTVLRS